MTIPRTVRAVLFFSLLVVSVFGLAILDSHAAYDGSDKKLESETKYKQGELLVKFKPSVSEKSKQMLHAKRGAEKIRDFPSLRLQHIKIKKGQSVEEAASLYAADPNVEYAEPNFIVNIQATPDDPFFSSWLWNMNNTGQTGGTVGADIDALRAWDITTGSKEVVVAVIDTGVDYNHPDLAGNLWVNTAEIPGDGIDNDGNGYIDDVFGINAITGSGNSMDDHGHGTHVSGTIGAVGNNGIGVVGVNWNVKIMACKFLNASGSGATADAVECLQYIKKMKDRGISTVATNNSWGMAGCSNCYSQALYDAINAQRDILFIAAAGNRGTNNEKDNNIPVNYNLPNIISVAATDYKDNKASFSSYGKHAVHIGAPGVDIISLRAAGTDIYRDGQHFIPAGDPNALYYKASGTSMAAPHVTGLAALLKAQDMNRSWIEIKNLILAGGENIPSMQNTTATGKRISAYGSLTCSGSTVLSALRLPIILTVGTPVTISALSINCAAPISPVTVTSASGEIISLHDDGVAPDIAANDGIFTGTWTPSREAELLTFSSPSGTEEVEAPTLTIVPYVFEGNIRSSYSHSLTAFGGLPPYTWSLVSGSLPQGLSLNNATGEISGTPGQIGTSYFTMKVTDAFAKTTTKTVSLKVVDSSVVGLWGKSNGSANEHFGYGIYSDSFGNSYMAGDALVYGPYTWDTDRRTFIMKYDPSGNLLWTKYTGTGDYIGYRGIALDAGGNLYVPGSAWDGIADYYLYIIKYNPAGNIVWKRTYNTTRNDTALVAALDANSNIYVAGITSNGSNNDYLIIKYDPSGNLLWTKVYDDGFTQYVQGATVDASGDVYVSGYTYRIDEQGRSQYDFLTVKWDSAGNQVWAQRSDSGGQYDQVWGVSSDTSGIYIAGTSGLVDSPCIIKKYDPSGAELWTKLLYPTCNGVAADGKGSIYVPGPYGFTKYDSLGTQIWNKQYMLNGGNANSSIAVDANGDLYTAGYFNDGGNTYYPVIVRYQQTVTTVPLEITTTSLPSGLLGAPYNRALNAWGGQSPYTWSVISGALPTGLSIDSSTGAIAGTPSAVGVFTFTIQVRDTNAAAATKVLSISISDPLGITTVSLLSGLTKTAYSQTLTASGGKTSYVWSIASGALPTGLSLNSSTGVIAGTPSAAGTFNFTVQVTDANHSSATKALSIIIQKPSRTTTTRGK